MAQAFEGALVALHRVAEERAADCADEVEHHRCACARATAVRAVGLCSLSRRAAAPPRWPPRRGDWRVALGVARALTRTNTAACAQSLAAELRCRNQGAAG